jgi:hypothetical protein
MGERSLAASALTVALAPFKEWQRRLHYDLLVKRTGLPIYRITPGEKLGYELASVDLLRRLCESHAWLQFPMFPVGGAANHAFLAILVRALSECDFDSVLEFGAGQTTRVLSEWSKVSGAKVCTIESDAGWITECRKIVSSPHHQLVHAPLCESNDGHQWYDFEVVRAHHRSGAASLIIVDGPVGIKRWSRAGFIQRFDELRGENWVVLWDDLHRYGDLQSFAAFIRKLENHRVPHGVVFCQAFRTLGMVFSPRYSRVKYYC